MTPLALALVSTTLSGVLSVLAAAGYLFVSEARRARILPSIVQFATGTLLGAALLALLPEALEHTQATAVPRVLATVLVGLVALMITERFVLFRHCHDADCALHEADAAPIVVMIGDGLHNFVDGALIGAAFTADTSLGITTAVAVTAHEVPQELGDFAIMLRGGWSRRKAITLNLLGSLPATLGGAVAVLSVSHVRAATPYVLALAAASFLYLALADLVPAAHRRFERKRLPLDFALVFLGIAVIWLLERHHTHS